MSHLIIPTTLTTGFVAGRREHQGAWHVYLKFEGGNGYGVTWRKADDLARALREQMSVPDVTPDAVTFAMPDRTYLLPNLPTADGQPPLSQQLYGALIAKARECEEQEKAPSIALDAAILHRAGAPIGLSNDPKIRAEAAKEAVWNENLRRVQAGNIKSGEALGAPSIVMTPPRAPKEN